MPTLTSTSTKDASGIIDWQYIYNTPSNGDITTDSYNGNDNHHPIGRFDAIAYMGRGASYFPISFSGISVVDSATLYFKQRPRTSGHCIPAAGGALSMYIYRRVADFGETPNKGEATWWHSSANTYTYRKTLDQTDASTGGVNWVTEGAVTCNFTQVNDGWVGVDITNIVRAWFDHSRGARGDAPNYGLTFVNTDQFTKAKGFDMYTRDASGGANAPYISIVYNSNQAPNAPTGLYPTGDALINSTFPTFSGNVSDPDAGDYITATQIVVYDDGVTVEKWNSGGVASGGAVGSFSYTYGFVGGINPGGTQPLAGNTFYRWIARTADKNGVWGPWSAQQRFKTNNAPNAPTLALVQTPTTDVKTLTPTVNVTHSDVDPGDTVQYGYQVILEYNSGGQIWDSGALTFGALEAATTKPVQFPSLPAWATSYRVRARTKDSNGAWGPFSGYLTFTLHAAAAPINLDPNANEITNGVTPTLSGQRADFNETIQSYRMLLYTDSNLSTPLWDTGEIATGIVGGSAFSKVYNGPALTQGTFYQWQAHITADIGGTSAYSPLQRFATPSDPTVPAQTSPNGLGIQGTGTNPLRPSFVGTRASSFNRFQIEVYPSTASSANLGSYTSGSSVDATHYWGSGTLSATITGTGPYTFTMANDVIPALLWNTQYKWRARVSADAGSTWSLWSNLLAFTMDTAGTPTLTSPGVDGWITDSTPDMTITKAASDALIDRMQIRVYAANGSTLLVGSTIDTDFTTNLIEIANTTTGTWTYNGPTLTGGWYFWQARYQKTTNGPWGNWSAVQRFRLNYPPTVPTDLEPTSGTTATSLLPTFRARFQDPDILDMGDTPSDWEIVIETSAGVNVVTRATGGTGLVAGLNSYTYDGSPALTYAQRTYQWKTRYKDSRGIWGPYSGYSSFIVAVAPNSTGLVPTDESTVNTVRPTLSWTYVSNSGSAQYGALVEVFEVRDPSDVASPPARLSGTANEALVLAFREQPVLGASTFTYRINNSLANNKVYEIRLSVINQDYLVDPTPQIVRVWVNLDAPDPLTGLSPTAVKERSKILLEWNQITTAQLSAKSHVFQAYNIYKRLVNAPEWAYVGSTYARTANTYNDWYAGNDILYEYKVTVVVTKANVGIELESGDDPSGGNISEATLRSDLWMFVGADRDESHIMELPVVDEDHNRVIQQESFETLGADRKVIIRGFVLGHEGSISMIFKNEDVPDIIDFQNLINETIQGRRLIDYLVANRGPHILKSPFGDVWDVQFEGPSYKWLPVGHLQVELTWIETGNTSRDSI